MPKLTYAIKDGQLVHISAVASGLSCECSCPSCGSRLEAKKGKIKLHHFSHYDTEECKAGYETSLHLLAKSVLSECKSMLLPEVYLFDSDPSWRIAESKTIVFDSVEIETSQGNLVPDIMGCIGSKKLYIEIRVAHAVDDRKRDKIVEKKVSCVEIDLSRFDKEITQEDLLGFITSDSSRSKWIYNNLASNYQKALSSFQQKINLIYHGHALHAQPCPISARTWHSIAYANFFDDCTQCEFLREHISPDFNDNESAGIIYCSGESKISCFADLKDKLLQQ